MSAEALFKRLDRGQKDALLAKAADTPLEDVLRAELPGFDEDTAGEFVCRSLAQNVDLGYRDSIRSYSPPWSPHDGRRAAPRQLRRIAKELVRREDVNAFLRALPHRLFDENQVHAFCIGARARLRHGIGTLRALPALCGQLGNLRSASRQGTRQASGRDAGACRSLARLKALLHDSLWHRRVVRLYLDELFDERFLCHGRANAHAQHRGTPGKRRRPSTTWI